MYFFLTEYLDLVIVVWQQLVDVGYVLLILVGETDHKHCHH